VKVGSTVFAMNLNAGGTSMRKADYGDWRSRVTSQDLKYLDLVCHSAALSQGYFLHGMKLEFRDESDNGDWRKLLNRNLELEFYLRVLGWI
jgi:hypothetical protein